MDVDDKNVAVNLNTLPAWESHFREATMERWPTADRSRTV
jgi:hypothetical protein